MKYSINWLKQKVTNGEEIKYCFFWGHKQQNPSVIDKSCFSQWFPAAFNVEGILYPTAEHWMMAEKARLFKDEEALSKILESTSPAAAKALGRTVRNFDKNVWSERAYAIVVQGNIYKFSQNASMKDFLLTTGYKVIVEASPRDRIWGIGMGQAREEAQDPHTWRGTNLLGFALMEARDEFLKQNV